MARTQEDAEEYIEKLIFNLSLRNNTKERKDKAH